MYIDWTIVGTVSSALASLAVLVTLGMAFRELRETIRSRSLDALRQTFEDLTCETLSKSRSYILKRKLPMPGSFPNESEEYQHMHRVWVSYDNLGIMVHHGLLPKEVALSMFYDSVIKCWQKLDPYIRYEEYTRGTYYMKYFKEFYFASCQYAAKMANEKMKFFKKALKKGQIGRARVIGIEVMGIYQKLGLEKEIQQLQSQMEGLKQTVFLDRDGTLNVDDYVTFRPEQFKLINGVQEGLVNMKTWGFELAVVTNQSGIGRGDYSVDDMKKFNQLLIDEVQSLGLTQDDFYFCPHDPKHEKCDCCKPNPGLFYIAAKHRNIDLSQSYMIGDKMSDILAGKRAGCKRTILVKTGITDDTQNYCPLTVSIN